MVRVNHCIQECYFLIYYFSVISCGLLILYISITHSSPQSVIEWRSVWFKKAGCDSHFLQGDDLVIIKYSLFISLHCVIKTYQVMWKVVTNYTCQLVYMSLLARTLFNKRSTNFWPSVDSNLGRPMSEHTVLRELFT